MALDGCVPAACEGHIAGLARLRLAPNQVIEDEVHELEDFSTGTKVRGQIKLPAEARARCLVEKNVRPPEAVDRLLRVAHEEEFAGADVDLVPIQAVYSVGAGGEEGGDLKLERVRVLELVDQDVREASGHRLANLRVVAEQPGSEHEQVIELEDSACPAVCGAVQRKLPESAQDGHQGGGASGGDKERSLSFGSSKRTMRHGLGFGASPNQVVF